jgi:ureidoglycolate hydrolase
MIDETILEIRRYDGPGFQPLIFFGSWRVALMNFTEELLPENILRVERHPQTDEVFVLLRGQATLFVGEGQDRLERFYAQPMEPGLLYNVKPQTWHTIVMSRDAAVLIVENADTGDHNSQFCSLLPEQRQFLLEHV